MYQLELNSGVNAIALQQEVLVCGLQNGTLLWFDREEKIFYKEHSHKNAITGLCFLNNSNLVSSSADTTSKLWSIEGEEIRSFKEHSSFVLTCSACDEYFVSGGDDCILKLWDSKVKKSVKEYKHNSQLLASEFKDHIYFGDINGSINVIDIRNMDKILYTMNHKDSIIGLHLNNNTLCSTSLDNTIKIWDISSKNNQPTSQFDHTFDNITYNSAIPFISDGGHYVACGSNNGNINVYELVSEELLYTLGGHSDFVSQVILSNNELISAGLDGKIIVGDINIMD